MMDKSSRATVWSHGKVGERACGGGRPGFRAPSGARSRPGGGPCPGSLIPPAAGPGSLTDPDPVGCLSDLGIGRKSHGLSGTLRLEPWRLDSPTPACPPRSRKNSAGPARGPLRHGERGRQLGPARNAVLCLPCHLLSRDRVVEHRSYAPEHPSQGLGSAPGGVGAVSLAPEHTPTSGGCDPDLA